MKGSLLIRFHHHDEAKSFGHEMPSDSDYD